MKKAPLFRIAASSFALLAILACGQPPLSQVIAPTAARSMRAEEIYLEINGIARQSHREIRQTAGTRLNDTPLQALRSKYDLSPRSANCPVYFAQANVTPRFSPEGSFHSAPLDEVVSRLKSGDLVPDQVPVHFIWVNGRRVTINNRSLTVLYKAGKSPTRLIDRTSDIPLHGPDSLEEILRRLEGMGGFASTEMLIRTAGRGRDGNMKKDTDWDAPIGEIVSMPEALLEEARTCVRKTSSRLRVGRVPTSHAATGWASTTF